DADEDHPYGHHRYETAASLVLGLLLLGVGVGMPGEIALHLGEANLIAIIAADDARVPMVGKSRELFIKADDGGRGHWFCPLPGGTSGAAGFSSALLPGCG
ncbi:cation transporter, partial [Acinetobacter baumannii]